MNNRTWFALAVLFAINLLNFFDRQLAGALGEPVRIEFGLNDTALGLLGTVFTLVYAAAGVPIGRLTDRWLRTRLISIGVGVWSLFTGATGLAWNYASLFVTRIGVGIGEAVCAPACQSLIGDLFPPEKRARALGIFMLGLPVGLSLAFFLGGLIGEAYGWRTAFLVAFVPGVIVAGLVLLIREPARGAMESQPTVSLRPGESPYRAVLSVPTLWWIIVSGALHNFNMYAVMIFQTPFLQRFHGLGLYDANVISALVVGVVGGIGLMWGGWLSDRLARRRVNGRLLLSSVAMLAGAPCVFFAIAQPSGSLVPFIVLMSAGIAMMHAYYPTVYAAIQDVVEPRLRGTAVALYFFAMYLLGGSLGPIATGMLSDYFARRAMHAAGSDVMTEPFRAAGLHDAMFIVPLLMGLCAVVLFAASRTVAEDVRRRSLVPVQTSATT
jgi:MFS family permease